MADHLFRAILQMERGREGKEGDLSSSSTEREGDDNDDTTSSTSSKSDDDDDMTGKLSPRGAAASCFCNFVSNVLSGNPVTVQSSLILTRTYVDLTRVVSRSHRAAHEGTNGRSKRRLIPANSNPNYNTKGVSHGYKSSSSSPFEHQIQPKEESRSGQEGSLVVSHERLY